MTTVKRTPGPGAERIRLLLAGVTDKVGKVGFFPSSKYEDGTPVAYVAAIQEFGSPAQGIPPRSFMRSTIAEKSPEWRAIADQGSRAMLNGNATGEQVLEAIGLKAAGDIRETISKLTTPALKPATVAARLSKRADKQTVGLLTKPLVDTGTLLNAVSSAVEDK
ncbi:MAG: hypothetical protein ACR652_18435 [Methylocystis sp.]|uniref:hypothetical protein n=1 Tax=Methylocystis sp. TaxID=1911079 RepID=UPI003DA5EB83